MHLLFLLYLYLSNSILLKKIQCLFVVADLRTMSERLKNRYYVHKKLFIADMTRIFTNCRSYNKPDTEYYRCANTMERFFKNKLKEFNLLDPQPPTTWDSSVVGARNHLLPGMYSWSLVLIQVELSYHCCIHRSNCLLY